MREQRRRQLCRCPATPTTPLARPSLHQREATQEKTKHQREGQPSGGLDVPGMQRSPARGPLGLSLTSCLPSVADYRMKRYACKANAASDHGKAGTSVLETASASTTSRAPPTGCDGQHFLHPPSKVQQQCDGPPGARVRPSWEECPLRVELLGERDQPYCEFRLYEEAELQQMHGAASWRGERRHAHLSVQGNTGIDRALR